VKGFLLLVLASLPVRAFAAADPGEGWHFSTSAGLGAAYGLAGLKGEVRYSQWAAFAGVGPITPLAATVGIRYYDYPYAAGFFASVHVTWARPGFFSTSIRHLFVISATLNYRWKAERWFFEVGLGPALAIVRRETRSTEWGLGGKALPLPDFNLGFGFEF